MNKFSKSLVLATLALGMQGCKDVAKDLFGFEDDVNVEDLVALEVRVTESDVIQEQTDWVIRADINLSVGDIAPEYQASWQIIDAPAGFNMPLTFVPANDEGQTFLNFRTPDVDSETEVTLQLTVDYNNGDSDEQIVKEVDVKIEANEEVVISGAVVDEPIPFATVTVVIGDLVFETQADGDGNYTIELEFKDNNLIALVTAVGSGDYSAVEFKSYLGDGETLTQQAGADGTLTADENDNITVSNISTAEFVLIENVLEEGETIDSQEQLDELASELDTQEVLEIAAVIKAVVDEGAELPEGTETVLDLLQDEEATEEFVEELLEENPDIINDLIEEIIEDPILNPEDPTLDITQRFFATKLGDYQSLTSEIINLEDNGTGNWSTYYGTFDVTWEKLERGYEVDFDDKPWISSECDNGTDICRDKYLQSATISTLPDTGAYKSIFIEYTYELVNQFDNTDVVPSSMSDTFSLLSEKELIPFDAAELTASTWAIRVLDESLDNTNRPLAEVPFSTTYATFDEDGTGTYKRVLDNQVVNFNWRIDGINIFGLTINLLEIEVNADENTDTTDHTMVYAQTYNRLGVRQTNLVIEADDFTKVPEKMLNTTVSMSATMSPVNDQVDVENTPLVGRYALLDTAVDEPDFFLQFNGDGTGFQESYSNGEVYTADYKWQDTELGLVAKYYTPMDGAAECHDDNLAECFVSRERTFEILDIQGDKYIVRMAQVWYRYDAVSGETYGDFYSSYIGIYQRLNQKITDVAGSKILLAEDGQVAQKEAAKIELSTDGTGVIYADTKLEVTWQQVNDYQVDVEIISGVYVEDTQYFCSTIGGSVDVQKTSTTEKLTLYGAPTNALANNRDDRWWIQSYGTDTMMTLNQDCAEELNRTEDWNEMEAFNVFDTANLQPLSLDNGQYVFGHEYMTMNTDENSTNRFSMALELMADGSATNLLDEREFTLTMDSGAYVFTNSDTEYRYEHYFEMLGDAYYAIAMTTTASGNESITAQLIVPFSSDTVTMEDVSGAYADVSNGYDPEVTYWHAFYADNTGGMGSESGSNGWYWTLEEDVTTTSGMETSLTALVSNRYRFTFFDEDNNGEADDINDDGVINVLDVDTGASIDYSMNADNYAYQEECANATRVCFLYNKRNNFVVQSNDDYLFVLRDTEWLGLGTDTFTNKSFGMFVWEKVTDSPLPTSTMEAANSNRVFKFNRLLTEEQKMNKISRQ